MSNENYLTMNSRQRLLLAIDHQVPDRVPISTYEQVGFNSGAFENNEPSYERLMTAIRDKTDCVCMWNPTPNALFLKNAYPANLETRETREGDATVFHKTLRTSQGNLMQTLKVTGGVQTIWQVEHWCKSLDDVDLAMSVPFEPLTFDFSEEP